MRTTDCESSLNFTLHMVMPPSGWYHCLSF